MSVRRPSVSGVDLSPDFDPTYDWTLDYDDGPGMDPDKDSVTLRQYHQHLWSGRPLPGLPDGGVLDLQPEGPGLVDRALGPRFFATQESLFLKSDRAISNWWRWESTQALRKDPAFDAKVEASNRPLDNMGGIILFPGHKVGGNSINQVKGFDLRTVLADRLDLTVECVRLGYEGVFDADLNPLGPTLWRYWDFFALFGSFAGYVDFWLLQDLLAGDGRHVHFFLEGEIGDYDFHRGGPLPTSVTEYDRYLETAQAFVLRRNRRMVELWRTQGM